MIFGFLQTPLQLGFEIWVVLMENSWRWFRILNVRPKPLDESELFFDGEFCDFYFE